MADTDLTSSKTTALIHVYPPAGFPNTQKAGKFNTIIWNWESDWMMAKVPTSF